MPVLQTIDIETAPGPRATIIILHGLGADGNDFVPFASELDLKAVGPVRFVFPHAPVIPVTINGGYRMRAWYDILGTEQHGRQDEAGLRQSQAQLEALLEREKALGMPSRRIVLGGFSQGCAMSLLTGLRHKEPLAGIIAMSGYLPLADTTEAERSAANAKTPIFQAHGRYDEMLVLERGTASRDKLVALGYPVEWHEYPMPHSVCAQEIADLNAWLLKVLA
ncbi:MAG TPA: carboxylesterase [Ramlibacter sp.]|uniref:alpha/beta hydrolase n=1 Tax=Ramlibacter sp. TaxID=1917967 RepID=UPI002CB59378|nr:carboxylesterase [Ramlibacter sp.]HVZ46209.1 carboxylesterase [Ramlibacter sp.]